jgi:deazaflavin-dependent oxidoreductase (nitroreductase family)
MVPPRLHLGRVGTICSSFSVRRSNLEPTMAALRRRIAAPVPLVRWLFEHTRPVRRRINALEAAQVERFGKSPVSLLYRTPVLVLVSQGRRSGQPRRTPLAYLRDGDDMIVVGGAAGQTATPDWVANLRTEPHATIVADRRRHRVEARELAGAERDDWWPMLLDRWPRIARYETLAGRPAPVFRFAPDPDRAPPAEPPPAETPPR